MPVRRADCSELDAALQADTMRGLSATDVGRWLVEAHAHDGDREPAPFDFDGDGIADRLEGGDVGGFQHPPNDYGRVRVLSGNDFSVLFEDWDPLEYECNERGFALGDLDGDGFGEIAIVHPRMDRSRYDLELWDALLGAKSWVSVVSGSRMAR
jgi:hypothetical protein